MQGMNASALFEVFNFMIIFGISLFLILGSANGSIQGSDKENPDVYGALVYLSKYGYLSSSVPGSKLGSLTTAESFKSAITEFQEFARLNVTGELDDETIHLMQLPRCGVKDKIGGYKTSKSGRSKRYVLQGSKWSVKNLKYKVTKYAEDDLSETEIDEVLKRAFQTWQDVTDLTFSQTKDENERAQIDVRFEKGEHGDGDPFDGSGGTLAHAYFPIYGGDIHFDDAEKFTIRTSRGINLFQVAVHELGHSLGLSHSDERDSLMAPFYRGYVRDFKLHSDDIEAIQELYGDKDGKPRQNPKTPSATSTLCSDPTFDAIFSLADDETYVFKGEDYYVLDEDSVKSGYPKSISEDFGIEGNVDSAFSWISRSEKRIYVFKGNKYWKLVNMKVEKGYPRDISDGFKGIPNNIDAAFVWSGDTKIYFMKGENYWKFDPGDSPPVSSKFPKKIAREWKGLPRTIDAAMQYSNGKTYFFQGKNYYRFNDNTFSVDDSDPGYPRPTGFWWFACDDAASIKQAQGLHKKESSIKLPKEEDELDKNRIDAVSEDENYSRHIPGNR